VAQKHKLDVVEDAAQCIGARDVNGKQIAENANEFIQTIVKAKPAASKGAYIRSMFMSSTMSPSIMIETKQFGSNI